MNKISTIFVCVKCDAQFPKWSGRCLSCGNWSTLEKSEIGEKNITKTISLEKEDITTLSTENQFEKIHRIKTGITELDRVLGGGIVKGSLILLGGEPGIGKSTLVLQIANAVKKTLYISGEESAQQVGMRLERLNLEKQPISFMATADLEKIIAGSENIKPDLVIIDSIQTIASSEIDQSIGSVGQIRTCTGKLLTYAKTNNVSIIIIGHITKDGQIAGPKTLEHMVDTVLYLEGDHQHHFRILRGVKNRFGSTNELGIFEMTAKGLIGIENPSALFLEGVNQNIPGSIVTVINEGKRCFLVEIQALVTKTALGIPQRKASGYDTNRLQLILAVLGKRLSIPFYQYDVFLNIVGGLKIKEVAIDLAICMSLISAYKDMVLDKNIVAIGEVGLGGELRPIPLIENRIEEAERLGFKKIYIPPMGSKTIKTKKIKPITINHLKDLIKK